MWCSELLWAHWYSERMGGQDVGAVRQKSKDFGFIADFGTGLPDNGNSESTRHRFSSLSDL
ncbi:hypothetical protein FA15DRAFT_672595 [Coprinopsis marcescibilis]|uniref:Uncharacterized protein n=1 Tax=Coprinopsis marcescibilis TaxID=230819 RepID=A0A5C3KZM2_COPMA|nr:hypothetical protein FA15DRAFT_672595 [Coprinopsis marcescibilis]